MVQFNLLPDVKLEYVKAQKTKHTVMLAAFTVTGLALFIFILMFLIVNVFQKQHLKDLNSDIKSKTAQLNNVQDLDKVLTVQNQLNALPGLHQAKPASSRMYDYLVLLTPTDAKVSAVKVDFEESSVTLTGSAGSLETINKFVDTIKFSDFKDDTTQEKAFSSVVLKSFGVGTGKAGANRTSYSIAFNFNPAIFDNTKDVQLLVPNIISTRSITEKPTDLFEAKQSEALN